MLKRLLLSGAAMAALSTFAVAQTAPTDTASPPAAATPADSGAAAPGMAVDPSVKADPNLYSNIKGASVVGQNDKSIGSVADLLIDSSGQLRSLVIAHGGLVGIGQTYRNYEVSALPEVVDGKITIGDLNTAALEGMPEYTYPEAETGRASTSADSPAPADQAAAAPASSELWPVSYLVGAAVGSAEDKASISDVRLEGNKVASALIDKGSLGLGNKVQEVQFEDLAISGSPAAPQIALQSGNAATNPNAESSTVPGAAPAPADSATPAPVAP